jgi:hypothetical protein
MSQLKSNSYTNLYPSTLVEKVKQFSFLMGLVLIGIQLLAFAPQGKTQNEELNEPALEIEPLSSTVHESGVEFEPTTSPINLKPHTESSHIQINHSSLVGPSLETVRTQVVENPHSTPVSLLEFAESVGSRMRNAFESEEVADSLFQDLKECGLAKDANQLTSVRAICLSNAKALVQRYPKFTSQMQEIVDQIDETVLMLIGG